MNAAPANLHQSAVPASGMTITARVIVVFVEVGTAFVAGYDLGTVFRIRTSVEMVAGGEVVERRGGAYYG